ncbi:MAG: hypothetical protein KF866_09740 [Phycisphaeraceae bacterium]|nr:hypothetical protein [Phycisphaeraceae bacterium]MCW5754780.1 hypothetical protein [Phycisphaeraceae bacterium]
MLKTHARRAACLVLGVGAAALVGCSGSSVSASAIRANPTPELVTLHQRQADVDNQYAFMRNANHRMILSDLSRFWYTDRPSRLTPEPMSR